jgi:hypothetical protein
MPMVLIESVAEFADRQVGRGGQHLLLKMGPGRWLLPNGAAVANSHTGGDHLKAEPPDDPTERLKLRLEYARELCARYEAAFGALKNAITGNGYFDWKPLYGPDPGEPRLALLQIRELAKDARRKLSALLAEFEALPGVIAQRKKEKEFEEFKQKQELARQRFLEEINAITLDQTFQQQELT